MKIKNLRKIITPGVPIQLLLQSGEDGACFNDVRDMPKELDSVKVLGIGTTYVSTEFGLKVAFEVVVDDKNLDNNSYSILKEEIKNEYKR